MSPSFSPADTGSAASRATPRLKAALILTSIFLVVEIVGGLLTGSLALLADAAHMGTDVGGLALALFAIWIGQKPASATKTYGYYRAEILAALANAVALFGVAFYILFEAYQRLRAPIEIASLPMLGVAAVGLSVNLASLLLLRSGATESLNVKGAYLEVMSDLLSSVGVIAAAGVIWWTGRNWIDPVFSVLIGFFILPRTWRLLREAIDVLMEATPAHLAPGEIANALRAADGVMDVHDLHPWTLTSGRYALSAHVRARDDADPDALLAVLSRVLRERFAIEHVTLQIEKRFKHEPIGRF